MCVKSTVEYTVSFLMQMSKALKYFHEEMWPGNDAELWNITDKCYAVQPDPNDTSFGAYLCITLACCEKNKLLSMFHCLPPHVRQMLQWISKRADAPIKQWKLAAGMVIGRLVELQTGTCDPHQCGACLSNGERGEGRKGPRKRD